MVPSVVRLGRIYPKLRPSIWRPLRPVMDDFGRYQIVRPLGEGGMGTVYLADQREPIRRRVAIKVVKLGMDTGQVLARFAKERPLVKLA